MKQPFILTLVSSVACAVTAANKAPENTTPTKSKTPNVVFIYADDLGYGDLECYGAKNVQTPNVNRLAKSGILFTNAHATAATSTNNSNIDINRLHDILQSIESKKIKRPRLIGACCHSAIFVYKLVTFFLE